VGMTTLLEKLETQGSFFFFFLSLTFLMVHGVIFILNSHVINSTRPNHLRLFPSLAPPILVVA